jgi:hypothetical protein
MRRDRSRERGARAAAPVDAAIEGLDEWAASNSPIPGLRKRVRALAEDQWGKPVVTVFLGDGVKPAFDVPGRRRDGTIEGERQARRFFWGFLRGAVNTVANVVLLFTAGGMHDLFGRVGRVTGPVDAQALGLADAVLSAKGAWLVYPAGSEGDSTSGYSPAHFAVIDLSSSHDQEALPTFLWQAEKPDAPLIFPYHQRLTWPDGSEFEYYSDQDDAIGAGSHNT